MIFFLDSPPRRRADQGESGNRKALPGDLKISLRGVFFKFNPTRKSLQGANKRRKEKNMENQTKETNSIITRQEEINQSVQGSFCSFVAETDEQKASLYKAMTSPDRKMSDFINQKINAVDVFVEQVEITDEESGEIAVLPRVVIFDQDGTTYSATSRGIFNALKRLFLVYGMPHWEKPIPLIIKQTTAKNRKFMTLDIGK